MIWVQPSAVIEAKMHALRQWSALLADFYRSLIDQGLPPDFSGEAALEWLVQELASVDFPGPDEDIEEL